MSLRTAVFVGAIFTTLLFGIIAFLFQDNLTRFLLNPRTPYQLYTPPPAPSYGARGAWLLWPEDNSTAEVDIFYLHSTTYEGRAHWNAPIGEAESDEKLRRIAAPNQAGPFWEIGDVYGPRYRQATLFAEFTHKFDGLAARQLAYQDIEAAFRYFVSSRPAERPFILVGYGQGGLHGIGLLKQVIANDDNLKAALVAAYLIDVGVPVRAFLKNESEIDACASPQETMCIVAFTPLADQARDEANRLRQRALYYSEDGDLVPISDPELLCVNPLLGAADADNERASSDQHLGAASATGLGLRKRPPPIEKSIGAKCTDGILIVDRPQQAFLRQRHWFGDQWRVKDYNLFYYDLQADAERRVETWKQEKALDQFSVENPAVEEAEDDHLEIHQEEVDSIASDDDNGGK